MSSTEEILDVVDSEDNVLGYATRDKIYSEKLIHRIVHVLLFNDKGEMALQLRSDKCSFCPLHWSTAVGGHVMSGENYKEAALREYEEELGTTSEIELIHKDFYTGPEGVSKWLGTFKGVFNGPFVLEDKVEKVEYFTLEKIREMVENGEKFHPELLFLLNKHFSN